MPDTSAFNIPHSPIAALGTITLLVGYVIAAYSVAAGIIGNYQHRRRLVTSSVYSLYAFFALMMLASALMIYAFVTHDYTIKYVTMYSDTTMPLSYKITAYWGGLDGSLLFWVAVLAAFSAVAVRVNEKRHRDMIGYVVAVIMIVQVFFLSLLVFDKNPFDTWLTTPPVDGKGLNPLLQNYWMVIHPPSLYIGFVAATIPFAFGIGALASGRLDDLWLDSVRVWMLICWFFLSFGLILGGRWAYEELGWGGYWAWDPVENAGLLPWFTATAFLHSVLIQEQRGMMKVWNLVLVITTFFLTIFGTFMTRSGVVQSVHAFGEDNELALLFILFMAVTLMVSFGLLVFRLPRLRSVNTFESFLSREMAFLLNNWILLASAFLVLFLTMFPTLSEAVTGDRITIGPPVFNKYMVPLALVLLFLAGAAPLLAWRRTSKQRMWGQFLWPTAFATVTVGALAVLIPDTRVLTPVVIDQLKLPATLVNFGLVAFTGASIWQEFWKGTRVRMKQTSGGGFPSLIGLVLSKHRKYGGYVVHLGVALMFVGFAGKSFEAMEDFTVSQSGESFSLRDYEFTYQELVTEDTDHARSVYARVTLKRRGEQVAEMRPERRQYKKQPDQPTTEVAIESFVNLKMEDAYLILTEFNPDTEVANFRVYVNPLINWVWLGFGVLALGTAICLVPAGFSTRMSERRTTRRGRVVEAATMLLVLVGVTALLVNVAHAQPAQEYSEGPSHQIGASAAHKYRPNDAMHLAPYRAAAEAKVRAANPQAAGADLDKLVAAELAPIVKVTEKLMRDLVCLCGGCSRETLLECRCGFAAGERGELLDLLSRQDLSTPTGRDQAYDAAVAHFIAKYEAKRKGDGQRVLMQPKDEGFNRLSWIVPYVAVAGALILLFGFGRRWVRQGSQRAAADASAPETDDEEDEEYADILDDELRETD